MHTNLGYIAKFMPAKSRLYSEDICCKKKYEQINKKSFYRVMISYDHLFRTTQPLRA